MATSADYLKERAFADTGQWHDAILRTGRLLWPDTDVWPERPYGNRSGPYYCTELDTLTLIVYGLAHHLHRQPGDIDLAEIQHWLWDTLQPVRGGGRPVVTPLRRPRLETPFAQGVRYMTAEQHVRQVITAAIGALLDAAGHQVPTAPVNTWDAPYGPVTTMWQMLLRFSPDEPMFELGAFDADPDPALWVGIASILAWAQFTSAGERITS